MSAAVTGGAGGITARGEDLLALAALHDEAGDAVQAALGAVGRASLGADLALSCALSPRTGAAALAALARAGSGTAVLLSATEGLALLLRRAVAAYRDADALLARAASARNDAVGAAVGRLAPALLVPVAAGLGLGWWGAERAEDGLRALGLDGAAQALDRHQDEQVAAAARLAERALLAEPDAVEALVDGAGGLLRGLASWGGPALAPRAGWPRSYEDALDLLAPHFPDGAPRVARRARGGHDAPWPEEDLRAPTSVADLLAAVDRRQQRDAADGAVPGEIGIKALVGPDGVRRWVVELPGTESWGLPGARLRDTSTNVHAAAGDRTSYLRGVEQAMAGVPRGEPVLLVGHSQGGMTAAGLAADPAFRARFAVTHVLTAGAPLARYPVPASVQVLALEHESDLVPRLDGRRNPDLPHVTTVTWPADGTGLADAHRLSGAQGGAPGYVQRAAQLPDDPSVRAWHASAAGFLDDRARVQHSGYVLTRELRPPG